MPETNALVDPEYAAARTVLIDALAALAPHRRALVVVGAQAIYLRTGSAGLAIAPYTTDGDLALDPTLLGDDPLLEEAMARGGFRLYERPGAGIEPGTWIGTATVAGAVYHIPVDLIVPDAVLAGGRTRGARLPTHGKRAARRTRGLEAALVDQDILTLGGLAAGDDRVVDVRVAGAAALLIAKVHKLADRVTAGPASRLHDKDAGDVLRLVRAVPATRMAERLRALCADPIAGAASRDAVAGFSSLFRAAASPGVAMAVRAVALDLPAALVEAQLTAYARELRGLLS